MNNICKEESSKSKATSYINKLLDNPLPLGVGALVVGLVQWKHIQARMMITNSFLFFLKFDTVKDRSELKIILLHRKVFFNNSEIIS